ncbi:MAG: hypothetical protein DCC49_12665 [Acidobacteria bacterium]|nr:MAG: hypothetical protein DCC49_12665 [Acidobacteriota bacterium]
MADVVGLVADVLDRSRIQGVARAVGTDVEFAADPDELLELIDASTRTVFVDLGDTRVRPFEAIVRVGASRGADSTLPTLIGFISHTDKEGTAAAKEAGCDEVLARSAFFRRLSQVLAETTNQD